MWEDLAFPSQLLRTPKMSIDNLIAASGIEAWSDADEDVDLSSPQTPQKSPEKPSYLVVKRDAGMQRNSVIP